MNWMYDKKLRAMLVMMANEDPNNFISKYYAAGLSESEHEELMYLIAIARRAPGYDAAADPFLQEHSG